MNKQAIIIIAHDNLNILKKIVTFLDSEYFDIFVHIDKKSKIDINSDFKEIVKKSKIFLYKEIDVRWADFSQVECELFLMKKVLSQNIQYDFLHLISGVDVPLKTPKEIYEFFISNLGKEFVHFSALDIPKKKEKWIKYFYIFGKINRKCILFKLLDKISVQFQKLFAIDRTKNIPFKLMTGSNWFSITSNFAKYVLENENTIYKYFTNTRSADELFIQTILYNSDFVNNLYYNKFDNNYTACMRYNDWERGNPYTFTMDDYEILVKSNLIFARKFDENVDIEIVDKLLQRYKTKRDNI